MPTRAFLISVAFLFGALAGLGYARAAVLRHHSNDIPGSTVQATVIMDTPPPTTVGPESFRGLRKTDAIDGPRRAKPRIRNVERSGARQ